MKKPKEKWIRFRITTILVFFCLLAFVVAGRAFQLQVLKRDQLCKLAERQYKNKIPLVPKRGTIYSKGYEELAVTVEVDSVYAEPDEIEDPKFAAKRLAPILSVSRKKLEDHFSSSKSFVWLARKVSPSLIERVKSLDIQGIGFVKENRRFYPNAELASHVVGFSGIDGSGLGGIELAQDAQIKGKVEFVRAERDALGKRTLPKDFGFEDSLTGNSIVLTIDKTIQYTAEKELANAVKKSGAKGGTAIVMDPKTGEVLAMANYPQFNPNDLSSSPQIALKNKAIVDTYEPGSTFKVFLLAAALEEGVVKPGDKFNCENGSMEFAGKVIHDTHKHGTLTVREIMKVSSNIGSVKIAAKLGKERYHDYLTSFGFGSPTGIELKGEGSGILRSMKTWSKLELANISFGQGVSVTPLQLATAFSAIANGGYLMKPYLIKDILDKDGKVIKRNQPQIVKKIISGETASKVTEMLRDAVAEGGTGTAAALAGYDVAGKTGTSQKVSGGRGYAGNKHVASFIGFVPARSPELVVLVAIDEPEGIQYGGVVAAPAFKAIAESSLRYLNTPDKNGGEIPAGEAMKVAKAE
ncbi:MAG: penicillin-binding transpeptidase domain-containing protein [Deltaproteobacteria bacterium]|nr:penicillin-binding transpeptidase domain-containing protein [Deltaproteobacteria bacterium]